MDATSPLREPRRVLAAAAALAAVLAAGACERAGSDGAVSTERIPPPPPVQAHVLALHPDRPRTAGLDSVRLAAVLARADSLERLRCLLVARHGETLVERCRRGFSPDGVVNVKSVSKSVLSALVGIAIDEGHLAAVDQRVAPLLSEHLDSVGPPKSRITIGHLLSMQSGLERTSGRNYGAWVNSPNWVRDAIRRPMVQEPGGRMLYSTGNYHLLSAILTEATGESTLSYARSRLGAPLGIAIPAWETDPQGIFLGGNNMRLTPRAMLRFGELYRRGGEYEGRQVVPAHWIETSLEPRTRSRWSGEAYGYGWFIGDAGGHRMFYGWGYGGQFVFVVPDLALTVVTTSDPYGPRGSGHLRAVHELLDRWIVPAAESGAGAGAAPVSG
ncbi:MAG: serine hydrolase [Longimicrobiales bacterium]|nr:serine hydrolase [Longimicrobiales bacterium]